MKNLSRASRLTSTLVFILFFSSNGLAEEHKISMKDWLFHPDEISINAGDTVTWVNEDDTVHDLAFEDESLDAPKIEKPEIIKMGESFSLTFGNPGEYAYICRRHRDFDMLGVIIVK